MKKIEFDNKNIVISETNLYFYGINIGLENIESVHVEPVPRRSLFIGLKEWFYGLVILLIIYAIWHDSSIISTLGDLYCYTLPLLVIFNIYMFLQKYYSLKIRTISGLEHERKSKSHFLLHEIKIVIDKAREEESIKRNTNLIVNNGIISNGNHNNNKVVRSKNYNNYKKIEEELKILLPNAKDDKKIIQDAVEIAKQKNNKKLKECLSKLSKGTIEIIKELGLVFLEKYIETHFFK